MAANKKNDQYEKDVDWVVAVCVADYKGDMESESKCREAIEPYKEEFRKRRSQAEHTEDSLRRIAAPGRGSALVLREEVEGMRQRMGYEEASEIEKLLIERVLLSWLRMTYAEKVFVRERTKETSLLVHQEFTDRQSLRAHNLYMRSIDALNRFKLFNARIEEIKSRTPKAEPNKGPMLKAV